MLAQDCWDQLLSELAVDGEVHLESFLQDSEDCGPITSVKDSLYELEQMGWIQIDETDEGTMVKTGWKADMFTNLGNRE